MFLDWYNLSTDLWTSCHGSAQLCGQIGWKVRCDGIVQHPQCWPHRKPEVGNLETQRGSWNPRSFDPSAWNFQFFRCLCSCFFILQCTSIHILSISTCFLSTVPCQCPITTVSRPQHQRRIRTQIWHAFRSLKFHQGLPWRMRIPHRAMKN